MLKALKWIGVVLGILLGLVVLAVVALNNAANNRINRTYDIEAEAITIPSDDASLARGEYLASALCTVCHGEGLSGAAVVDETGILTLYAPNITPSEAGVGEFSDADYVRAMRHGIGPDGRAYMFMPVEVIIHWSEEDLGATIAYLQKLPPDDYPTPERDVGVMGRIVLMTGIANDIFPAEYVDHDMPFPTMPEVGANAEYGAYFAEAAACTLCHGADMESGPLPRGIDGIGDVPSAVSAASWSTEEFITAMTLGDTPDGRQLDPVTMPRDPYASFNEADLEAIHLYLQTLTVQ